MIIILVVVVILLGVGYAVFFYDNGYSGFSHVEPVARDDETRTHGNVKSVLFPALDGALLEGWLFTPTTPTYAPAPLVIMAPGLTGTKEGHLEPFAWQFVEARFCVLLFDFRGFGGSQGEPRHWVDPFRHADDYRAAIRFATDTLAAEGIVDASRITLWGSSFSGGIAIEVAASDHSVAALIAQCPYVDTAKELEPTPAALVRYVFWTMIDLSRAKIGALLRIQLQPVYVPAFGKPGELAFAPSRENPSRFDATERGAAFWQTMPSPLRGGWENKLLARLFANLDSFKPINRIEAVRCPILLIAAEHDDLAFARLVRLAFDRISHDERELSVLPCGHFDLYMQPTQANNASIQIQFLTRYFKSRA